MNKPVPFVAEPGPHQLPLFTDEPEAPAEPEGASAGEFSRFIVYVDESGDHVLNAKDPSYPVFVLAFCVFYKTHYADRVVPALERFKFNRFGHDAVVLHEHEIRKELPPFKFQNRSQRTRFLEELTGIIERSNFILIACAIDKLRLTSTVAADSNAYHVALGFCLETLYELMQEKNQDGAMTHVVFEARGKKEDNALELVFRRICDGENRLGRPLPFSIVFADKKTNSAGLQLADLVARPVGLSVIRPGQANRAFDVLRRKFFCRGGRAAVGQGFENVGLKLFPAPESEKPR